MTFEHESRSLTEQERSALAALEARFSATDPHLSRRLDGTAQRPARRPNGGVGVLLVVLGAALALATFTTSLWLAVAGLAIMAGGIVFCLPGAAAVRRRFRADRAG